MKDTITAVLGLDNGDIYFEDSMEVLKSKMQANDDDDD
jgi:hypothetical protein